MLQLFAFTPEPAHVIEMAFAIVLIHRANSADQRFFDRGDANKSQNIALKTLQAVSEEIPAIDPGWHAHGHNNTRRPSGEELCPHLAGIGRDRKAWAKNLFQEGFQQRRHGAEPKRINDHQVSGPGDVLLCCCQRIAGGSMLPVGLTAKKRHIHFRNSNTLYCMAGFSRAACIGARQSVAVAVGIRIRMAVDDRDAFGSKLLHRSIRFV